MHTSFSLHRSAPCPGRASAGVDVMLRSCWVQPAQPPPSLVFCGLMLLHTRHIVMGCGLHAPLHIQVAVFCSLLAPAHTTSRNVLWASWLYTHSGLQRRGLQKLQSGWPACAPLTFAWAHVSALPSRDDGSWRCMHPCTLKAGISTCMHARQPLHVHLRPDGRHLLLATG